MVNPDVNRFIVFETDKVIDAIKVIDANAHGICFVTDQNKKLTGILTDGDLRRAFIKNTALDHPVSSIMNTQFQSMDIHSDAHEINHVLNERIKFIPLIDSDGIIIDYASKVRTRRIPIMQPNLNGNELKYVSECITTGWISSQGSFVKEFEKKFADYCGATYALSVSNGTTALHLAMVALNIGEGDEVIVPDFTFAASINAIMYTGATPVIVDVNLESWTIDIESIKAAITPATKAIMPVHIYGHPCDMAEIVSIAEKHKLYIIEDCAEALGSTFNGKAVGTFSEIATFSFFGNKTITTGEGGMLLFKEKALYDYACILRDHGMSKSKRYWHDHVGFNYRLTNLQAAVGVAQMERVEEIVSKKRALANKYTQALSNLEGLQLQGEKPGTTNTHWLYTILVLEKSGMTRDELAERLIKNGIETRPAFYPLHDMPIYLKYKNGDLSNSSFIAKNGISLPSYADLEDVEVEQIIEVIRDIYKLTGLKNQN